MGKKNRGKRYPAELKARGVRMVAQVRHEHESDWSAICSVAEKLGCSAEALRTWVRREQQDGKGSSSGKLTTDARARMKELERENRDLRQANEILRKASAYFAQAELDRRRK